MTIKTWWLGQWWFINVYFCDQHSLPGVIFCFKTFLWAKHGEQIESSFIIIIIEMFDIIVLVAFVIVIVENTSIASSSSNHPDWHLRVPRLLPLSLLLLFLIFLLLLPLLLLLLKTLLLPLLPAIIQIGTCVCQDRCLYHSCCLSMMTSCVLTVASITLDDILC